MQTHRHQVHSTPPDTSPMAAGDVCDDKNFQKRLVVLAHCT